MEYLADINKYYENQGRGKVYLIILFIFASLLGWYFINFYRPIIVDTGCSEIAEKTSNMFLKRNTLSEFEKEYSFENIKKSCVEGSSK